MVRKPFRIPDSYSIGSWTVEPFWAGPRTYGYEWVVLENEKKRNSWLDPKPPPRGGDAPLREFKAWFDPR